MKKIHLSYLTFSALCCTLSTANAQAVSAIVGIDTVTCLADSDTVVSVPFINSADSISSKVSGAVSAAGSAPSNTASFSMGSAPTLVDDQLKTSHYLRFTSGTLDGNIYQISSNSATTVTIDLNGDSASDIADTNSFKIYKFWTLGSLFPQATQKTLVESTGNLTFERQSLVLLPATNASGTKLAPNRSYFIKSSGWVDTHDLSTADDTILWPNSYLIIRHPSSVSSSTVYYSVGAVDENSQTVIPLSTITTGPQENFIAIPRPVDVKLTDLDLTDSNAFVASAGNLPADRRDELFVYDNAVTAHNRSNPSASFFHNGTQWINASDLSIADNVLIESSTGLMVKKYQTNDGATSFWKNTPKY